MIIYNSTWSISNQWIMIVRWHSDPVNKRESLLNVCNRTYHMNKRNIQKGEEIEVLRNYALLGTAYWIETFYFVCWTIISYTCTSTLKAFLNQFGKTERKMIDGWTILCWNVNCKEEIKLYGDTGTDWLWNLTIIFEHLFWTWLKEPVWCLFYCTSVASGGTTAVI